MLLEILEGGGRWLGSRGANTLIRARPMPTRMALATVELDAQETMATLHLVRARLLEVERMIQNMEEGEGMDLQRHNALKTIRPQAELLEGIVLKLEGASRELETGRSPG